MIRVVLFFSMFFATFNAKAVDVSSIDKAVRSPQSKSIMFRKNRSSEREELEKRIKKVISVGE